MKTTPKDRYLKRFARRTKLRESKTRKQPDAPLIVSREATPPDKKFQLSDLKDCFGLP